MGSNPKLPLDISYLYSKFGFNRPTQVTEPKSKSHSADFSITTSRFSLKTWLKVNSVVLISCTFSVNTLVHADLNSNDVSFISNKFC